MDSKTPNSILGALTSIGGSLFLTAGLVALGYFYFLSNLNFNNVNPLLGQYLIKLTTIIFLLLIFGIILIQMLFFSQTEMKQMVKKPRTLFLGKIITLMIAVLFLVLCAGFIHLMFLN